jgi:hypothetical protein
MVWQQARALKVTEHFPYTKGGFFEVNGAAVGVDVSTNPTIPGMLYGKQYVFLQEHYPPGNM